MSAPSAELDPARFRVRVSCAPGFRYATVDEGDGPALLLVRGWPETKRIWWRLAQPRPRPPTEAADYFLRQGSDADALARELDSPEKRRRYVATFYSSRFWAHLGTFTREAVDFMTEPFADGAKLRASFASYESSFDPAKRREPALLAENPAVHTPILYGPSDHVIYPEFDRMAAQVFPDHVGPFLVRDAGHLLQWEAADVLNGAVISFCRDLLRAREEA